MSEGSPAEGSRPEGSPAEGSPAEGSPPEGSPPEDDSNKETSEDVTEALDDSAVGEVNLKLNILRLRQEESFESVSNRGVNSIN